MSMVIYSIVLLAMIALAYMTDVSNGFAALMVFVALIGFLVATEREPVEGQSEETTKEPPPPPPEHSDYYHGSHSGWSAYRARHRTRDSFAHKHRHRHRGS